MDSHIAVLCSIMVGVGAFAGFTAAMWATEGTLKSNWLRYTFIGIVATTTVPLFLTTIQSDLIRVQTPSEAAGISFEPVKYLVFAGLCALVAFYAPTYLQRLSDRILQQLDENKKKIEQTQRELKVTKEQLRETERAIMEPADHEVENVE